MNFAKNKWLILGLVTYVVIIVARLSDQIGNGIPQFLISSSIIACIAFHLLHFRSLIPKSGVSNVEKLFINRTVSGFVCLFVALLPVIANSLGLHFKAVQALQLAGFYALFWFLGYFLMGVRKLGQLNERSTQHGLWDVLFAFLLVSSFYYLKPVQAYKLLPLVFVLSSSLLVISLSLRIKWIVSIRRKVKWLSILFLTTLIMLTISMVQIVGYYDSLQGIILYPLTGNIYFIILILFLLVYSIISILALLFNMPVATVTEQRIEEIRSFQEINRSVMSKAPIDDTLQLLFGKCFNDMNADAGWLMMKSEEAEEKEAEDETGENETFYTNHISQEDVEKYNSELKLRKLVKDYPNKKHHYLGNLPGDLENDESFVFKSLLIMPVFVDKVLLGNICLMKRLVNSFDDYQIQLGMSYLNQVGLAFENNSLTQASIEAARVKQELDIARKVQKQLLPTNFPESDYFELAAYSESAVEVGGDYYDFILFEDNRLAVIIADVAGSGASAAFYMAHLKGVFQSLGQLKLPVSTFLEFTNEALSRCLDKRVFITLTYCLFDFGKKKAVYGRAGHTPVLFYNAESGQGEYLVDKGLGLGIIRNKSYSKYVKTYEKGFESGDMFVFFTDGINESRSGISHQEYGTERLLNCVVKNANGSAGVMIDEIVEDYYGYVDSKMFPDDHTIVAVKIK